jgi:hypothetical protein
VNYWCGPSYLDNFRIGRIIKRRLSKRHNPQCAIHDYIYTKKIGDRYTADYQFFHAIRRNTKTHSGLMFVIYSAQDYTYYLIVRMCGWTRWGKD